MQTYFSARKKPNIYMNCFGIFSKKKKLHKLGFFKLTLKYVILIAQLQGNETWGPHKNRPPLGGPFLHSKCEFQKGFSVKGFADFNM